MRPKEFSDIVGQDHLIGPRGVITRMLEKNMLSSCILYGPAGCGKTSIAEIIASRFSRCEHFNASTDNKARLKEIVEVGEKEGNVLCIVDEIHRLKKDTQDYLLPSLEKGSLTIVGLTTENPYRTINPAIRSRCHVYRMNEVSRKDVTELLRRTSERESIGNVSDEIIDYISQVSSCEIRTALNMLEIVSMLDENDRTLDNVKEVIGKKSIAIDEEGENYYDIASAMIKSIRGSDPDAGLHYLARLLQSEDLEFICRRLTILAYEDVGMANPGVGPRVYAACQTALNVGLPEAKLPLAYAVVDLATSPKSNSTCLAIGAAEADLNQMTSMSIPPHILNKELKGGKVTYKYPHDFPGGYVDQQYMPDHLKGHRYYHPKATGSYEKAVGEYLKKLKGDFYK